MNTRLIQFRAKHYETGQWIYGAYVPVTASHFPMIYTLDGDRHRVDENTVGQYAGMYDDKEQEIYEGDIVKYGNEKGIVVFDDGRFLCDDGGVHVEDLYVAYYGSPLNIIGNIHDNPELVVQEGGE